MKEQLLEKLLVCVLSLRTAQGDGCGEGHCGGVFNEYRTIG